VNEKNLFGGGNAKSLYVPMSETEQEVIARLVETDDLEVVIHGWGTISDLKLTVGDAQICIPLTVRFDNLQFPVPVTHFDLELRTRSGLSLFKERQSAIYDGQPLMIGSGTDICMIWHIGVKCMDPKVVKSILPGAKGLTSRLLDKDTGSETLLGNMKLDAQAKKVLAHLRQGEARGRAHTAKQVKKA